MRRRLVAVIVLAALPSGLGADATVAPDNPAKEIGFDQNLGGQVDLELRFRDASGKDVRLRDFIRERPVILSLAYYGCPMLCGLALQGLARSVKPLAFEPGREFDLVTVSFDPRETAAMAQAARATTLETLGRRGGSAGWHFLTGDEAAIRALTEAVGFRYKWDEQSREYAHATGIVLLTPEGRISRYLFGIDYAPKDLRLGLIESAGGRIGSFADRLLLLCYRYDPHTGRYSAVAMNAVRGGAVLAVLGLGIFLFVMIRRERERPRPAREALRS